VRSSSAVLPRPSNPASVIDKLVLGVLVVIAGFVANWALERAQANQAFEDEIPKVRVEKIGTIWSALSENEELANDFIDTAAAFKLREAGVPAAELPERFRDDSLKELKTEWGRVPAQSEENDVLVDRLLIQNRFWIGERLYSEYSGSSTTGRLYAEVS
jgi:hypothetical protein